MRSIVRHTATTAAVLLTLGAAGASAQTQPVPAPGVPTTPHQTETLRQPRVGDASQPRVGDASQPRVGDASQPRVGDAAGSGASAGGATGGAATAPPTAGAGSGAATPHQSEVLGGRPGQDPGTVPTAGRLPTSDPQRR